MSFDHLGQGDFLGFVGAPEIDHSEELGVISRQRNRMSAFAAPDVIHEPPAWTLDALCLQVDPEIFFPEKYESCRAAKLICARCPVRAECLAFALEHHEHVGIYGGMSPRQRARVAREQRLGAA